MKNQHTQQDSDKPTSANSARTCNCMHKSNCTLNNKCLSNNVLYKAKVTSKAENYGIKFITASVRPGYDMQLGTIENFLKTQDTKQALKFPVKSGN